MSHARISLDLCNTLGGLYLHDYFFRIHTMTHLQKASEKKLFFMLQRGTKKGYSEAIEQNSKNINIF